LIARIDILVKGAGPVGCAAALALHRFGKEVQILSEKAPAAPFRPIVLSYASRLILERLGVWQALAPVAIDTIRVSQAGGFGRTVFDARDAGVPALGYVLEYSALLHALRLSARDLFIENPPAARCVVHAEGAAAQAGEKRYAQDALVARVEFDRPAANTAFERFTREGPLALLPLPGGYAVVWSARPQSAQKLLSMGENEFLEALAAVAGTRPGRPVGVQERAVQPLALRVRKSSIADREIYIGNAAQTLHPVAGQGLNLGLRDAWDLAQIMRAAQDPGEAATLARFAARRRLDAGAAIRATDLLATIFVRKNPFTGLALTALDVFPAPRRFFARRMIFGPSALP
jgi:2-octaprenyl-6-methoxyphenol hydroxylase